MTDLMLSLDSVNLYVTLQANIDVVKGKPLVRVGPPVPCGTGALRSSNVQRSETFERSRDKAISTICNRRDSEENSERALDL